MEERPGPVKLTAATEAVAPASRSVLEAREETAVTLSLATLVTQMAVASTTRVVASSTDLAPLRVETADTVTAATPSVVTVAMLEQYQDCRTMYSYGLPLCSLSFHLSMGLLRQKVVRLLAVLVAMYSATSVGLSEIERSN